MRYAIVLSAGIVLCLYPGCGIAADLTIAFLGEARVVELHQVRQMWSEFGSGPGHIDMYQDVITHFFLWLGLSGIMVAAAHQIGKRLEKV